MIWQKLHQQIPNENNAKGLLIFFGPLIRTKIPKNNDVKNADHNAIIKLIRRKFIYRIAF